MRRYSKISNKEKEELLEDFCDALSVLNNSKERMAFIVDLLTKQEAIMMARRIKIAKMIIEGKSYQEINNSMHVSFVTISKINQWLLESGEGFRIIYQRSKKQKPKKEKLDLFGYQEIKKRYPAMFWPQLLTESIIKNMNRKQKDRIKRCLKNLDYKSEVYKNFQKALRS